MNPADFTSYKLRFEMDVICKGVISGVLGKIQLVSIRPCKQAKTDFANYIGTEFIYPIPLAIDYYGLIRKSNACVKVPILDGMQELTVVYFASIKVNHINFLCRDLLVDFVDFKEDVIKLRRFNKDKGGK